MHRQNIAARLLHLSLLVLTLVCFTFSISVYSQQQAPLDAQTQKKILVVGDSLSAAYKLSAQQGWVHLLREKLKDNNYPYQVINASVSGATTAAGIQIMKQSLASHNPDIVMLELGGNDGLQGKPVSYITKNLDRLITMATSSGAQVVLIGIQIPPNLGRRYTQPFFQQYQTLADKYKLPLVPFLLDKVAGYPTLMQEDGIHPRAEGQPIVLENVWPVLAKVLSKS